MAKCPYENVPLRKPAPTKACPYANVPQQEMALDPRWRGDDILYGSSLPLQVIKIQDAFILMLENALLRDNEAHYRSAIASFCLLEDGVMRKIAGAGK